MSDTTLDRRPVSLTLAVFQSHGDPVMQCRHGVSLFEPCEDC